MADKLSTNKLLTIMATAFVFSAFNRWLLDGLFSITPHFGAKFLVEYTLRPFLLFGFIFIALTRFREIKRSLIAAFILAVVSIVAEYIITIPAAIWGYSFMMNTVLQITAMLLTLVIFPALSISLLFKSRITLKNILGNPLASIYFLFFITTSVLVNYFELLQHRGMFYDLILDKATIFDFLTLLSGPQQWRFVLLFIANNAILLGTIFLSYRSIKIESTQ